MTKDNFNSACSKLLGDKLVGQIVFDHRFPEDELFKNVSEKFLLGEIEESADLEIVRRALKQFKEQGYLE